MKAMSENCSLLTIGSRSPASESTESAASGSKQYSKQS
eukprot:CAMPEP_0119097624 /NCGR_PEP_ID=MMETSP1178-20130426/179911_1 /TAXON_ID=33656 /ORGANISM="unid sp, Strain CCMP2000" /LENGTH=37 /DNA_ID= /DNA_START= /DNA_END= /DNA_ORIENTATION=